MGLNQVFKLSNFIVHILFKRGDIREMYSQPSSPVIVPEAVLIMRKKDLKNPDYSDTGKICIRGKI